MVETTRILPFDAEAIAEASRLIAAGQPVAVATETVYGLAADATNAEAVARIYEAKGRPSFNPLIVHVPDLPAAERIGHFSTEARELAEEHWTGPLTLVVPLRTDAGIAGLEFFSGVPGTIGGALRMNAGAYGTETRDVLVEAVALDRHGNIHRMTPRQMGMSYRHTDVPEDFIFTQGVFTGSSGAQEAIKAHIADIKGRRAATQPIREKTGGSTFANPSSQELEAAGLPEGTKAWQLVDRVGGRGLCVGGAAMSELHANFMINTGTATATDLETLGEEIIRRVREQCGIILRWEIKRIGEALQGSE